MYYSVYSIHYKVYTTQYTVYTTQYTLYSIQYTLLQIVDHCIINFYLLTSIFNSRVGKHVYLHQNSTAVGISTSKINYPPQDVYGVGHVTYGATWQYKSWTDAVQSCKDKGLVIAFPRTFKENQAILADIKKSFKTHPNARKYAHENWVSQ